MRITKADISQIIKEEEDKLLNEALPPKIRIPKIKPRPIIRPRPMPKPVKLAPGTGLPSVKPIGQPILKPQEIPQFKPTITPETPSLNILDPTQFGRTVHQARDPDDPLRNPPGGHHDIYADPTANKPARWVDPETGHPTLQPGRGDNPNTPDTTTALAYMMAHKHVPTDQLASLGDDHFINWRAKQQEARMKRWEDDPAHKGNPHQRYMVFDLKEHLKKSYIDGGHKKAWISAGVPEVVYNDTVLPRIINNLNSLPVYFSAHPPPLSALGRDREWPGSGVFYTPRNSVYMSNWDDSRNTFISPVDIQSTLAHEVGHRISHDPMLAAILNRYKKKYTPTEMHRASDLLALNWGGDPQIRSRVLQHGKPDPLEYHPASVYEPYTLKTGIAGDQISQQTSVASMQPVELMSLLNMDMSGPTPASEQFRRYRGQAGGFNWFHVGNKALALGVGSLSPRERLMAQSQLDWRTKIEEIYADVQAVKALLGRPMTETDVINTCLGVDTEGSRAINKRAAFRDFLDCRDAKKTADTFNKIVKVEPRQAPTSMVAEQKNKNITFNKHNTIYNMRITKSNLQNIIQEEFTKMLNEQNPMSLIPTEAGGTFETKPTTPTAAPKKKISWDAERKGINAALKSGKIDKAEWRKQRRANWKKRPSKLRKTKKRPSKLRKTTGKEVHKPTGETMPKGMGPGDARRWKNRREDMGPLVQPRTSGGMGRKPVGRAPETKSDAEVQQQARYRGTRRATDTANRLGGSSAVVGRHEDDHKAIYQTDVPNPSGRAAGTLSSQERIAGGEAATAFGGPPERDLDADVAWAAKEVANLNTAKAAKKMMKPHPSKRKTIPGPSTTATRAAAAPKAAAPKAGAAKAGTAKAGAPKTTPERRFGTTTRKVTKSPITGKPSKGTETTTLRGMTKKEGDAAIKQAKARLDMTPQQRRDTAFDDLP